MKYVLGILVFLSMVLEMGAQNSPIDSLRRLAESHHGEEQVRALTKLAKEYAEINPDSALIYGRKAYRIAKENHASMIGQALISISTAHSYLANYDSSTFYSYKAVEIAENSNDTLTLIDGYNNLGIDFMFMEEDEKAIQYYEQVRDLSLALGDSLRLGHAFNNLGMMFGYAEDSEKELDYYKQASIIFKRIREVEGLGNTLLNAGTVYTASGDYGMADLYYDSALQVFEGINYTSGIQNVLQSSAENNLARDDYLKADNLAKEALRIALKYDFGQDIVYTYDLLEKIALARKDYKKAYEFELLESQKKEELFTTEKSRQINELETRYQTAQKEAQIEKLALSNELKDANLARSRNAQYTIGIGGGLSVVLLLVFFTLRHKKQLAEKEAQELQIDAMKKRFMELHASPAELAVSLDFDVLNEKLNTPLTEREFDALRLSLEGKSNAEISDLLFISVSTVKFHLRNTYSKMGVGNRKEAFQYMLKTS